MGSTQSSSERSADSTDVRGNGSYEPVDVEDAAPLKVQMSEHMDSMTRKSLQGVNGPSATASDFALRAVVPLLLAIGGAVWLWRSRARR